MRKSVTGMTVKIWLSANDTYNWAHKAGASWPCSTLSGHRIFAEFYNGDLVDISLDGSLDKSDRIDGHEFNACMADFGIN